MAVHKRTEEEQKDLIFDIFSQFRDDIHSDTDGKKYLQLCEQVNKWRRDYPFLERNDFFKKNFDNMGMEIIAIVIDRFIKNEIILKKLKDKDSFFKYLNKSLNNEKKVYYRECGNDTIKISKEKKRKLREVKDFIRMKERQLGRKLTYDERRKGIFEWFKKQEYVDLLNVMNVGKILDTSSNGDNKIDLLNYGKTSSDNPLLDEYITKINMEALQEVIKSLLNKKQERSRDCYKALFTLYCIKNDLRGLYPILDQEIIDSSHKDDKKPNQYEIYQKYHPKAGKKSAEAMASTNLREFLNDIETYLKEKNQ